MLKNKILYVVAFFFILLAIGSGGFYIVGGEKWSVVDSIYMTIITLSTTVGFGEVHELTETGKIWAIVVIMFGVTGFAILISQLGSYLIEFKQYRNQKMENKIKKMKDHYIICGYGRMGAVIAKELSEKNIPFVIIEINEEKTSLMDDLGYKFIKQDATLDETLINANIEHAKGIVVILSTDQENLFVTMSARNLNQAAYVLGRCAKEDTGKKLKRAGANKVINPYITGGHKMAELLLAPYLEDTVSLSSAGHNLDIVIDEFKLKDIDRYDGIMIKDSKFREDYNLVIVGLIDENEKSILNPDPHTILNIQHKIILLGSKENIDKFSETI